MIINFCKITQFDERTITFNNQTISLFIHDLGEIKVAYKDYTPNVGSIVTFYNTSFDCGNWRGFNQVIDTNEDQWWRSCFLFYSDDYPTKNYYNISLYDYSGTRGYSCNLLNV